MNIGSATSEDNALQYLINMFTDKDIIQLPCQSILGRLIPLFIYNKSIMKHRLIGGFSHVPYWTNIQAKMLQQYLDYHSPETGKKNIYIYIYIYIYIIMTYCCLLLLIFYLLITYLYIFVIKLRKNT